MLKNTRFQMSSMAILVLVATPLWVTTTSAQTVLFSDSFDRVSGTPMVNGDDGGTSTWGDNDNGLGGTISQTYEIGPTPARGGNRHQYVADPSGGSDGEARFRAGWAEIQYDFGNSVAVDQGGGLSIEFDSRVADLTPGWLGIAIGQPMTETDDGVGQNGIFIPVENTVDFGIIFKGHIDEYSIFVGDDDPDAFVAAQNGTWHGGDDVNNEQHFRLELATPNLGESGVQATMDVFVTNSFGIENQVVNGYAFDWDADGEAYIAFSSNKDQGAAMGTEEPAQEVAIDNLVISTISTVMVGLTCDFDANSECNPADLDTLYGNIGTNNLAFDISGDGAVTSADIESWLTAASDSANPFNTNGVTFKTGDVDFDGDVDSTDLGVLLNNFGDANSLLYESGNLNGDANVDSTDLGVLLNNFGFASLASNAAAVPEPSALWLVFLPAILCLRFSSRRRQLR